MTVSAPISALLIRGSHRFATTWRIDRADGVTFRFTDHNRSLLVDGDLYTPAGGFNASARDRQEGLSPQNLEATGVITDDAITEADLRGGKYRRAVVTERLLDWKYPWVGDVVRNSYLIRETTWDGEKWQGAIESLLAKLQTSVGDTYERRCRWQRLGDSDCGVNLAPFTVTGSVASVVTARKKITTAVTSQADGYFDDGRLVWTSGANDGLVSDVKAYLQVGTITLHVETPLAIAVGATFSLVPGCDRQESTCKNRFVNFPNFGGFPHIPGNDDFFKTPSAK